MSSDRFWTAFYFLFMPDNVVLKIRPSLRCRSPRKEIFVLVYAVLIDVAMIYFYPDMQSSPNLSYSIKNESPVKTGRADN